MLRVPKLQKPNTLPRARIESAIRNRHRNTRTNKRRLDVRRHIIAALCVMQIQALTLLVLGHNAIQRRAHVRAHILVEILIERQRARSVLDEEVEQACLVLFYLGDFFQDVVGY